MQQILLFVSCHNLVRNRKIQTRDLLKVELQESIAKQQVELQIVIGAHNNPFFY
jgi:hypothetical protein